MTQPALNICFVPSCEDFCSKASLSHTHRYNPPGRGRCTRWSCAVPLVLWRLQAHQNHLKERHQKIPQARQVHDSDVLFCIHLDGCSSVDTFIVFPVTISLCPFRCLIWALIWSHYLKVYFYKWPNVLFLSVKAESKCDVFPANFSNNNSFFSKWELEV